MAPTSGEKSTASYAFFRSWGGIQVEEMFEVANGTPTKKAVTERITRFDTVNLLFVAFELKSKKLLTFFPLDENPRVGQTRQKFLALHHERLQTYFSQNVPFLETLEI